MKRGISKRRKIETDRMPAGIELYGVEFFTRVSLVLNSAEIQYCRDRSVIEGSMIQ